MPEPVHAAAALPDHLAGQAADTRWQSRPCRDIEGLRGADGFEDNSDNVCRLDRSEVSADGLDPEPLDRLDSVGVLPRLHTGRHFGEHSIQQTRTVIVQQDGTNHPSLWLYQAAAAAAWQFGDLTPRSQTLEVGGWSAPSPRPASSAQWATATDLHAAAHAAGKPRGCPAPPPSSLSISSFSFSSSFFPFSSSLSSSWPFSLGTPRVELFATVRIFARTGPRD